MKTTFTRFLLCACWGLFSQVWGQQLPTVSSQYLTQGNDYGAIQLDVMQDQGKIYWQLDGKQQAFTQANLYQYLDDRLAKFTPELAQQSNIKLAFPAQLSSNHFQTVYIWLQIYGAHQLHLKLYEMMEPDQVRFLSMDLLPFEQLEAAAQQFDPAQKALVNLQTLHPNSSSLLTSSSKMLRKDQDKAQDYLPKRLQSIEVKADGSITFNGQASNPSILATLLQNNIAEHYQNKTTPASSEQYLWFDLKVDSKASYQQYVEVLLAIEEAFQLYWEELSFNQHGKTYLELDVQDRWEIQQAAPRLLVYYNDLQSQYWEKNIKNSSVQKWSDL